MDPIIRKAELSDIDLLVDLMDAFYAESDYRLDRRWASESFKVLLSDPALGAAWLLFHDEKPAGYIALTVRFAMEYGGLEGHIDDLFVAKPFRRIGLGRLALRTVIDECRRRRILALRVEVGRDNVAARALYSSFGLHPHTDGRQLLTARLDEMCGDHT